MKLTYIGPLGSVRIPLPNGRSVECAYDESCEVPEDLGQSLLEQEGNWKREPGGQRVIESIDDLEPPDEEDEE